MINILILAIIFGYGGFVLYRMHKKKKEGGRCCGCSRGGNCSGCGSVQEKK